MSKTPSAPDKSKLYLRAKILQDGAASLNLPELYELLLGYVIHTPCYVQARILASTYPSLSALFSAEPEDLRAMGLPPAVLSYLYTLGEVFRLTEILSSEPPSVTRNIGTEAIAEGVHKLIESFRGEQTEYLRAAIFAGDGSLLGVELIGTGDFAHTAVPLRKLTDILLRRHAASVLLAHNHPDGVCFFSAEDEESTAQIHVFLRQIGITLLDHIITDGTQFVSMLHRGTPEPPVCPPTFPAEPLLPDDAWDM